MLDSPWPAAAWAVRRQAAARGRADRQPPVVGPADGDRLPEMFNSTVAPRGGLRAQGDRHPHVLADLSVQRQPAHVLGLEKNRSGPIGASWPARTIVPRTSSPGGANQRRS